MSTLLESWRSGLPAHWSWSKLNRVAHLGTGHTPDRTKPEFWAECDIPWVTAADLSQRQTDFAPLLDTAQKVSSIGIANSAAVVHPPGTVMFCRTASVGLFCAIGKSMATTQAFVTWTPGDHLDSRYLLYVISALRPEFDRLAYGSTHLTIYMPDLEALRIPLPPLAEQRRIADFLDDQVTRIDQSIHLRKRQAELVRKHLTSRLQSLVLGGGAGIGLAPWFVGLPPQWHIRPLRSAWSVIDCKHRTPTYQEDGIPVVSPGDVSPGRLDLARCNRFVNEADYLDLADALRRCAPGDIVYSRNASAGTAAFVETLEPFTMGQDVCRITSADQSQLFLFHALNSVVLPQLESVRVGSTFTRINVDQIKGLSVPLPPVATQMDIAAQCDELSAQVAGIAGRLSQTTALREERKRSLITAAVTGEFDVPSASVRASGVAIGGPGAR